MRVFEEILSSLEIRIKEAETSNPSSFNLEADRKSFDRLKLRLKHDSFVYQDKKIVTIGQIPLTHLESIAVSADFPYLLRQLDRIESSIDSDPWLAIGTAKELIETICKSILTDLGTPFDKDWELMELCKETRKELEAYP